MLFKSSIFIITCLILSSSSINGPIKASKTRDYLDIKNENDGLTTSLDKIQKNIDKFNAYIFSISNVN